ncbi:MAG: DNA starvation/stationary phase protection protein Dps [Gemmatimonadaceae bacterium]
MARQRTLDSKTPLAETVVSTKNDLPKDTRNEAVALLNSRLADAIDLQSQCKQAHWNVKGPHFIALHKLFDEIYEAAGEYVDLIAERVVQLGGVAEGTVRVSAQRSTLIDYPMRLRSGDEHVAALSDALSAFSRGVRMGVDALDELGDVATVDILTEILRETEKWLWFVEAHQQGVPGADTEENSSR